MASRRLPKEPGFEEPKALRYWGAKNNPNALPEYYSPRQKSLELDRAVLSFADRKATFAGKRLYYVGDILVATVYHQFDRWWIVLAQGSFFSALAGRWFNSEDAMEDYLIAKLGG